MRGIKLGLGILIITLMMMPIFAAIRIPVGYLAVISFQEEVEPLACYYEITSTNLRTEEIIKVTTNKYLESVFEWSNSKYYAQEGDQFLIKVANQQKTITYTAEPPTEFKEGSNDITIVNFKLSEEEQKEYCIPIPDEEGIPFIPETVMVLIAIILAFFGIKIYNGSGFQLSISKSTTGKLSTSIRSHKHYGISGLHSIYTIHRNENIAHPKGELDPKYLNGKYVPVSER